MKVGDLVQIKDIDPVYGKVMVGLVTELGVYVGNCDVKVLWGSHPDLFTERSAVLEVVQPS